MTRPRERYDVAVVGGGSAGVAAALAAAGLGARTLLVERSDRLGGNAALAFVHTICGLYHDAGAGDALSAHPGLPGRLAVALARDGVAARPERAGRVWFLPIDPQGFARRARAWCERAAGLDLALRASLASARAAADGVELELDDAARRSVAAAIVVDASGDAAAAAALGAEVEAAAPGELQSPSYIVRLAGVDTRELGGFERVRLSASVAHGARQGRLPEACESVLVRPHGPVGRDAEAWLQLNVPRPPAYDPLDPHCVEALTARGREGALAVLALLRGERPAFVDARVAAFPARVGIRETRRARGEVVLERGDVLDGARRDDEVAVSTWPIELWRDHRRARFEHARGPCSIPLAALCSRSHARLGMAGRCLSATHEALGALRVIGTAMATGEAIGVAAALAADVRATLRDVAPARVRDHIGSGGGAP